MIRIETKNETSQGFDLETHIEGDWLKVMRQVTSILDKIYEAYPVLFEQALLLSKYCKDHT